MNHDQFSRLEERIEQIVEGSFARLFGSRLHPREVAVRLARAVEDNVQETETHQFMAPNDFQICLNPEDARALHDIQPDLTDHLANTVVDFVHRVGLKLETAPTIEICADPEIALRDIRIFAEYKLNVTSTQVLAVTPPTESDPGQGSSATASPPNPQLIINGNQYVPLQRTVTNLGRKRDNHIPINDARVSRQHAQIRLRFGKHVLYDLGSKGGTFVNNHRITEVILHPGDVISLAGFTLVYVEDDTQSRSEHVGDTQIRAMKRDSSES